MGNVAISTDLTISGAINVDSGTLFVNDGYNRVGIGTAGPVHKLDIGDVSGNIDSLDPNDIVAINTGTNAYRGIFLSGEQYNNVGSLIRNYYSGSTIILSLGTRGGSGTTNTLNITAGNVGIGTTGPTKKLHVVGDVRVQPTTAGFETYAIAQIAQWGNAVGTFSLFSDGTETIHLDGYSSTASYINAGNVGIGTTGPTQKLDVTGAIRLTGGLFMATEGETIRRTVDNSYLQIAGGSASGATGAIVTLYGKTHATQPGYLELATSRADLAAATTRLQITGGVATANFSILDSNVGIGTTGIAQKLHVNGNAALDGNITLSGSIVVGSPTGGDKGAGTINATAVYDDNVLLTDYVFDKYFDGKVREEDQERYGNYQLKSLDEMARFIERERHLPTLVGREQWKEAEGKLPLGKIVTQLWETVETQALYIKELKDMLIEQKEEIGRLKSMRSKQPDQAYNRGGPREEEKQVVSSLAWDKAQR